MTTEHARPHDPVGAPCPAPGACPLCGAGLVEIRAKAVCGGCGRIVESCCEGAPEAGPR